VYACGETKRKCPGPILSGRGIADPICVEGERACPPEDVGGAWGYAEYLQAIADSKHDQHEEMLQWRAPFEAEKFDANKATKAMRRGLLDWRQYE
jgi:hypothetical protein